jgi:cytochrome c
MSARRSFFRFLPLFIGAGALLISVSNASAQTNKTSETSASAKSRPVPRATPKDARALLERAVALLKEGAPEKVFAAFNDQKGEFVRNDLYVFVVGLDGIMRAHGGAPEGLVGMQVADLHDASGKALIREILDVAKTKGSGEVDYVWLNFVTNRVESKTALIRRVGDNVVAVGFYVPRSSAEQAKSFLDKAVAEIGRVGASEAFAAFNNRRGVFVHDDLYVFVVGLDDAKFYAMGATPGLVGAEVGGLRDAAGKPIIQDMIALAREKGGGEYDYVWRNPANNKVEAKRSLVKRVDGYLVGVGYYTR